MPYIGRSNDKISNVEILTNLVFDGSSSYSITKNSVPFTPNSAQSLLISIDGVVQATNFTVNSSTIDFGVAIPSTSVCNFFLHYGTGVMTVPSDGSVTNAKLGSGSFSNITGVGTLSSGLTLSDNILFDTASKGIYLGVTSATSSNLLDDYEEGTFTPAYSAGGGFSATYAKQIGNYTKIGNKVTCWITLFTNTVSLTSSANLTISGLPFASLSGDVQKNYSGTIGRIYRWSSDIDLHAVVDQGASSVNLYYHASNATNILPAQTSQLTSGSNGFYNNIDVTITYQTA